MDKMRKYEFEDKLGERYVVEANNEKDAWKKFAKQTDYTDDNSDLLFDEFTLKTDYPISSSSDCDPGHEWVPGFRRRDGSMVKGFCRRKRNHR